ncbi:MAG: hypothetical protein H6684_16050, partial [Deltaproteobacteria bacterium]|nr:hypothetical protein [Deltaproteobacteria bacterium]
MPRRALSFYIGLALVTAGTLALEIVQTRLLSVVSWYHLAFFVISVAMFGMTLGALTVFLRPTRFTAASVDRDLALYALWAGVATGLAYLDQSVLAPEMVLSASAITVFTRLAITVSIPFFFSGICVTLALTRTRFPIAKSYGADLVGAAAGCLLVIPLLGWLDGPGAVFSCGAIMALGAVLFATRAEASRLAVWAFVVAALWMAVAYANSRTVYGLDPIIVKGQAEKRHRVAYEKWNSFSRVVAYRPAKETPTNLLWAPSMTVRGHREKFDYVQMNIDGLAGAKIIGLGSVKSPEDLSFLGADTTAIAYAMRKGDVAVIGVGGGKDLATALATGQNSVLGVEINPALVGAISGPYRELAGLVGHPKVRIETDEARSYMTRDDGQYDIVQASLIDTWAATGAGAFTLSENSIYTVQAWRIFLDRLAPGGIFTVSRWYAPERVDETARLVSLALGTLFKRGAETPSDHILLAAHDQVATILVSNEPFSLADIETFRTHCVEMRFDILMTPAAPPTDPTLASLAAATSYRDLTKIAGRYPLDISPPTDARPFFFNLLRLSRPWEIASYLGTPAGVVAGNLIATLTLLTIILVTLVLGVATVAIPWRFANRATPEGVTNRRPSASALAYFALIGFGFMFVEIG